MLLELCTTHGSKLQAWFRVKKESHLGHLHILVPWSGPSFCLSLKSFISTWCTHTHTHLKNSVPCHDTSTVPHRNLHETLWPTKAQSQVACNNRLQQICYQQRIAKEPSNEKVNVCFYAFDRKELWWGSFWDLASSMAQCDAFTSSTKERCSFAKLRKDLCIHRLPLLPLIFLRSFWLVDCYIVMVLSLQTWLRCWHGSWSRKRRDQSNKTLTQI